MKCGYLLILSARLITKLYSHGIHCSKNSCNKKFQVLLQYDPSTELSKRIYKNISKFVLHWQLLKIHSYHVRM